MTVFATTKCQDWWRVTDRCQITCLRARHAISAASLLGRTADFVPNSIVYENTFSAMIVEQLWLSAQHNELKILTASTSHCIDSLSQQRRLPVAMAPDALECHSIPLCSAVSCAFVMICEIIER